MPVSPKEKFKIETEIHKATSTRDSKLSNFLEYRNYKIIYRRYAGLYFSFCVDLNDNELAVLELIHLFVEILDGFFSNVCELDLVFHFDKVYMILDELFLSGEISETSAVNILTKLNQFAKLD